MIQIVPCAGCKQSLVLPPDVSLEATIECSQCGEQFVVGEMLETQLGSWKVIDDPGQERASELELARTEPRPPNEPRPPGAEEPAKPKADWSDFKPITHDQFERMKRKTRSPIWSMLQVVLGGVAAVPISLLLLWHVLDKDVGGAGPWVGKYAPWVVPEKYRPFEDESFSTAIRSSRKRGESDFRKFDDVIPMGTTRDRDTRDEGNDAFGEDYSQAPDGEFDGMDEMDGWMKWTGWDEFDDSDTVPMEMRAADGGQRPASTGDPASKEASGVEGTGQETRNIFAQIQKCERDLDDWSAAVIVDGADLKIIAKRVYEDLIGLATTIDQLPTGAPVIRALRDSMQPIGRTVKRRSDVQQVVQQGARFWIGENTDRDKFPLAMIVEIESVSEEGAMWTIAPAESTQSTGDFTVIVPRYIAPTLISGQRLFMLGTVTQEEKSESNAPSKPVFRACYLHGL